MKVIEGLKPWEVMRLHDEEGKRVAINTPVYGGWKEVKSKRALYLHISDGTQVAIIDDSQPEIDWDGFDWGFFNQWDGVHVDAGCFLTVSTSELAVKKDARLRESPFYPWFGDECPVPGNVEVEWISRGQNSRNSKAKNVRWSHNCDDADIIAFRLTGRVL